MAESSEKFACPMHPEVQSSSPGTCRICGMPLEKASKDGKDEARFIEDPGAMMAVHPSMMKWIQPVIMILGLWLITSPMLFEYRSAALIWSDVASGIIAIVIAGLALKMPNRSWISYGNCFTGLWLLFAPLLFWSPTAAGYATDTMIGALLITFSFIIPMGMPMPGPEVPAGWSYNPSTWPQRAPIIALGLIGFFLARPMAGYQLGHIDTVWDPFFGDGSITILTSDVSSAWPVSDAGLGAMVYLIELLSTFMGDQRRWRTMPWMVAIFGVAVIPLGVTSILLVIMQPLAVGAWCTLCLITAGAMLLMIPLALDEVVAMVQFLIQSRREGKSVWRTFWRGGTVSGAINEPQPERATSWMLSPMFWGFTGSWNLAGSVALGGWLMFAPDIFGSNSAAADSDHLVGALVITVAMISMAEVGRSVRYINLLFGIWLAFGSWFLSGGSPGAYINSATIGLLLICLSFPLGQVRDRYGNFDRFVVWSPIRFPALKRRHV